MKITVAKTILPQRLGRAATAFTTSLILGGSPALKTSAVGVQREINSNKDTTTLVSPAIAQNPKGEQGYLFLCFKSTPLHTASQNVDIFKEELEQIQEQEQKIDITELRSAVLRYVSDQRQVTSTEIAEGKLEAITTQFANNCIYDSNGNLTDRVPTRFPFILYPHNNTNPGIGLTEHFPSGGLAGLSSSGFGK